jgi:formiminotetrahydrofolate cyclodeaminase
MTSKEFVAFVKGIASAIDKAPTEKQWKIILENLMKIKDEPYIKVITEDIKKIIEKNKKFPGAPPDVYM